MLEGLLKNVEKASLYQLCFFIGTTVQAGQPQQLLASPGGTTCPTVVGNQQQQLTIQLPTQPQPIQGVKTLTYVAQQTPGKTTAVNQLQTSPSAALGQPASTLQPVKLATPTFAYTSTGEFTEKLSRCPGPEKRKISRGLFRVFRIQYSSKNNYRILLAK